MNPDDAVMETLVALKPEWFVYDKPFLMNTNRKVLYGFVVTGGENLKIPDRIIYYDNLFIHEETCGYKKIYIGANLREIVNTENAFGYYVEEYVVDERNQKFVSYLGMMLDELPEDDNDVELILFPSGRRKGMKNDYIQFPFLYGNVTVREHAFCMKGFIRAIVFPPLTTINKNSFCIQGEGGVIVLPVWDKDSLENLKIT